MKMNKAQIFAAAVSSLILLAGCGSSSATPDDTPSAEASSESQPDTTHEMPKSAGELIMQAKHDEAIEAGFASAGEKVYKQRCASCHDKAEEMRAPNFAALQGMSAPQMTFSLKQGKMKQQAMGLDDYDIYNLINYLSPNGGEGTTVSEAAMCKTTDISFANVPVKHWGAETNGSHYYSADKTNLTLADAKEGLELAWAFGVPNTSTMRSHPVITDDTLFLASTSGDVFALDRLSGCVKWHQTFGVSIRAPLSFATIQNKPAILFTDVSTMVHAIDAKTGELIWKAPSTTGPQQMSTGGPIQVGDLIIAPLSAIDVGAAMDPNYECCKGHGAVVALKAENGEKVWEAHMTEEPQMTTKSSVGTQLWGPSGAPVWTTPAIDEANGRIYIGTGENTSAPATDTSDAIMALDLKTGDVVWTYQALPNDTFNMACSGMRGNGPNCPDPAGPDFDFGGGVTFTTLADGREVVIGGQKSGDVHMVDAATGELLWKTKIAAGTALGGVHWGVAVSPSAVIAPSSDPEFPMPGYDPKPGMTALDPATGEVLWHQAVERGCAASITDRRTQDTPWPDCSFAYSYSAAPAVTDEFIAQGALDGKIRILDVKTGETVWMHDTKAEFETVNGVSAHGGAIDNMAPALVGDMMYVQSGYSLFNQMPGNVLLAFRKKETE